MSAFLFVGTWLAGEKSNESDLISALVCEGQVARCVCASVGVRMTRIKHSFYVSCMCVQCTCVCEDTYRQCDCQGTYEQPANTHTHRHKN